MNAHMNLQEEDILKLLDDYFQTDYTVTEFCFLNEGLDETTGFKPLNRAIGGEAIANTANRMHEGRLYTTKELDDIEAFVIMQVHNKDVFDPSEFV